MLSVAPSAGPALLPLPALGTHFLQTCWEPLRYSCSKAGRTSWWRLKRLCSMRVSAGVGGSRHSGMNTMKDRGSGELSSSFWGGGMKRHEVLPSRWLVVLLANTLSPYLCSSTPTSKWETMASMSSSQNGGLASKEPLSGEKSRQGLGRKVGIEFRWDPVPQPKTGAAPTSRQPH